MIGQLAVSASGASGYRTNVAFVNPSGAPATASMTVRRGGGAPRVGLDGPDPGERLPAGGPRRPPRRGRDDGHEPLARVHERRTGPRPRHGRPQRLGGPVRGRGEPRRAGRGSGRGHVHPAGRGAARDGADPRRDVPDGLAGEREGTAGEREPAAGGDAVVGLLHRQVRGDAGAVAGGHGEEPEHLRGVRRRLPRGGRVVAGHPDDERVPRTAQRASSGRRGSGCRRRRNGSGRREGGPGRGSRSGTRTAGTTAVARTPKPTPTSGGAETPAGGPTPSGRSSRIPTASLERTATWTSGWRTATRATRRLRQQPTPWGPRRPSTGWSAEAPGASTCASRGSAYRFYRPPPRAYALIGFRLCRSL